MWKDVAACMMSDEEDVGENTFKTHQPEWQSAEFNEFLKQLDAEQTPRLPTGHILAGISFWKPH